MKKSLTDIQLLKHRAGSLAMRFLLQQVRLRVQERPRMSISLKLKVCTILKTPPLRYFDSFYLWWEVPADGLNFRISKRDGWSGYKYCQGFSDGLSSTGKTVGYLSDCRGLVSRSWWALKWLDYVFCVRGHWGRLAGPNPDPVQGSLWASQLVSFSHRFHLS